MRVINDVERRAARSARRRGGALVIALIVAVTVAAASASVLLISSHYTRRQMNSVHDQRAFYLAEAGLSEGYNAVTLGQTGQIGSRDAPALSGAGLLWVEATEAVDGSVRLESTALVGLGRASLALVVERVEQPLGIFADQDLVIEAPVLIDGYDSEEAPYEEQVQEEGIVKVPKDYVTPPDNSSFNQFADDPGVNVVDLEGVEFIVVGEDDEHYFLELLDTDDSDMASAVKMLEHIYNGNAPIDELPINWSNPEFADLAEHYGPVGDGLGWGAPTDWSDEEDDEEEEDDDDNAIASPAPVVTDLGNHTAGSGKLASNGDIVFTGTHCEIYGDVVPGPDGEVVMGSGNFVSGHTSPRAKAVELPPVTVPQVSMQPAVEYGGGAPMIIPPSTIGYDGLTVLNDAEVIVRGPSTLVIGDLELQNRATFQVENLDGPVDMYVTRTADLALGSIVTVASQDPSQLTLRFLGGPDPVRLASTSEFRGIVYGPKSIIEVESPFEVFGGLIGYRLELGAGVRLHFDAGLTSGTERLNLPKLISWDITEVPPELKARRMDPFEAMGLDRADLVSANEAAETVSWTLKLSWPVGDSILAYEGPFELWDPSKTFLATSAELTPPDIAVEGEWIVYVRYYEGFVEKEWEGPVSQFPNTAYPAAVELLVTPPPELLDQGHQTSYFVMPGS